MNKDDLQREREASAERRKRRMGSLRRPPPDGEAPRVNRLTSAQKKRLQEDEFVLPSE